MSEMPMETPLDAQGPSTPEPVAGEAVADSPGSVSVAPSEPGAFTEPGEAPAPSATTEEAPPEPPQDEVLSSSEEEPSPEDESLEEASSNEEEGPTEGPAPHLGEREAELEEANAGLLAQLEETRSRLLAETIKNVELELKLKLDPRMESFLDTSQVIDEDGLPNREAVTEMVKMFGGEAAVYERSSSQLNIGAYSRSDHHSGFGDNGHLLDARNRKFSDLFKRKY